MNNLKDFDFQGETIKLKAPPGKNEQEALEMVRDLFSKRYEEAKKIMEMVR